MDTDTAPDGALVLRKTVLALLASLLFMISFTLFQYASWWPALAEDTSLEWSGLSQGRTFAELAPAMLEFSAVLASAFWPLFLLTPRPLLLSLFAGLWLWQTYDIAFMTATASTWLPHEIIRTFILPHSPLATAHPAGAIAADPPAWQAAIC